jgi:2'-5' RNA ligase
MRQTAFRQLAQGEAELDALIDSPSDDRRGITLLARPPAEITGRIDELLADFQRTEPCQYYYPASDIHVTILSIISCYSGFILDLIDPQAYQDAVRAILPTIRPFTITYDGLTASPGSIIVQGFPQGDGLAELRDAIRNYFRASALQQSIDQRYSIQTAHSTVIRFKSKLENPQQMLQLLEKYQHHFIGTFEVNTVELVYNDWYQRAEHTILLEQYALTNKTC